MSINLKKIISLVVVFSFLSLVTCTAYPLHAQTTAPEQQGSSVAKDQERPGAIEQTGNAAAPKASSFPWLIVVAGVVVVGVLLYFLVIAKKSYTLTVTKATGVDGTPAAGATSYTSGTVVNYAYTPQTGYYIEVKLDGAVVANSGTVTMDKEHTLAVTAYYDVRGTWYFTLNWAGHPTGHASGTFSGTPTSGTFLTTATYTVNGNNLTLLLNDSYHTTYIGTLTDKNTMNGTMSDNLGSQGTWSATRLIVATTATVQCADIQSMTCAKN